MNRSQSLSALLPFLLSLLLLSGCAPRAAYRRSSRPAAAVPPGATVAGGAGSIGTPLPADTVSAPDSVFRSDTLSAPVCPAGTGCLAPPADSLGQVIAARLAALTAQPLLNRTQAGIYVYDLTAAAPLFAFGADQQMRPASCQKVVTAVAALSLLGPDYRYRTRLVADGAAANGVLRGNLYIVGGFDPLFTRADADSLALALRRSGVAAVEGDLVADRSLKDTLALGWGWCWDDDPLPLTPCSATAGPVWRNVWPRPCGAPA